MRTKKEKVKILIVVSLLLLSISCLYYYFFIKLDIDLIFWKSTGEKISWNSIEYDDDFFPVDSAEVYGEYGEWKFKEFRPIYAGYDSTEDGLNFLIGKYLDEDGKEKVVNILVSGEGIVDYPWPDTEMLDMYNVFFKESVALVIELEGLDLSAYEDFEYTEETPVASLSKRIAGDLPENLVLTETELGDLFDIDTEDMSNIKDSYFIAKEIKELIPDGRDPFDSKELKSFEEFLSTLEVGDQIGIIYLSEWKDFESCRLESEGTNRLYCVNGYLNEVYGDVYMVATYIDGSL